MTKHAIEVSEESFDERLARLRKAAGYTQKELGEELGISQRMVAYYESQTQHPPTKLMPALATALGVSADELLGLAARRPAQTQESADDAIRARKFSSPSGCNQVLAKQLSTAVVVGPSLLIPGADRERWRSSDVTALRIKPAPAIATIISASVCATRRCARSPPSSAAPRNTRPTRESSSSTSGRSSAAPGRQTREKHHSGSERTIRASRLVQALHNRNSCSCPQTVQFTTHPVTCTRSG